MYFAKNTESIYRTKNNGLIEYKFFSVAINHIFI